jgi:hypothetical protein
MNSELFGKFDECPRCGWSTIEKLSTHSYCINCNYNSVEDVPHEIPYHVQELLKVREENSSLKKKYKNIMTEIEDYRETPKKGYTYRHNLRLINAHHSL